jgi:diaminopimelate epimerase
MRIEFKKMNGAGNDFILIDNRQEDIALSDRGIRDLCDRRRGIGADGLILLESKDEADFRMRYYNSDGGEAEMCGNGARCVARFAAELGLGRHHEGKAVLRFATVPGIMEATVEGKMVAIRMTDATSFEKSVSLPVAQRTEIVHLIYTGVPHVVIEETDVDTIADGEILARGRAVRSHKRFTPDGTNVNFVSILDDGVVKIRTYERGVEGETLACGTGAVAGAVVAAHLTGGRSPVTMITHGGEELAVSFVPEPSGARQVVLKGPTALNFGGSVVLPIEGSAHGV